MFRFITFVVILLSAFAGGESRKLLASRASLMFGSDVDEYGCKASAGYTWCKFSEKCLYVTEDCVKPQIPPPPPYPPPSQYSPDLICEVPCHKVHNVTLFI